MARPQTFVWPAASVNSVSLLQSTVGAGSLLINGSLATINLPLGGNIVSLPGITRTISLTSLNDLHLVNFTISGFYEGIAVFETRVGPNDNTVYTTQTFDTVTSVTVDAAVTNVSVGTGTTGFTKYFNSNNQQAVANLAIQVTVAGTISYTFQTTLYDADPTATQPLAAPITAMTTATTSQFANLTIPTRYSTLSINSSDTTGSLTVIFMQQGII